MKTISRLLAAILCFAFPSWAAAAAPPHGPLAQEARDILQTHCGNCHAGGKAAKGGFGFVLDRDRLISRQLILPGKASGSELFARIDNGEMPPPSVQKRLTPAEIKTLRQWIDAGAPQFDPATAARPLTQAEVVHAVLADLEQQSARQRKFARYLTL